MKIFAIRQVSSKKFSITFAIVCLLLVSLACGVSSSGTESAPVTQAVDQDAQATQVALQVQATLAAQQQATEPPVEVTEEPVTTEEVSTTEETSSSGIPGVELNPNASEPGEYYYTTEFDAVDDWTYYVVKGDESGFTQEANGSMFEVEILKRETYVYFINDGLSLADVQLDTRVENLGQNTNYTGLVCRFDEDDATWYEANILNTGEYYIYMHDREGNGFHPMYTGASREINMGKEINEYTFICSGEELTLGINGVEVRKIPVKTQNYRPLRNAGKVGIFVASTSVFPLRVQFDWFTAAVPY